MRFDDEFVPDTPTVRTLVTAALASGRSVLNETETAATLAAYGIPTIPGRVVQWIGGLAAAASAVGYPVALRVVSADILHKSDVAGIALHVATPRELEQSAQEMLRRCSELRPLALIEGFAVHTMRPEPSALYAGIAVDGSFGPVVAFGSEETPGVCRNRTLGLPPPNSDKARTLVLDSSGFHPSVHAALASAELRGLESVLVRLGRLALDVPQIVQLDIDPLLADEQGIAALDALVRIAASHGSEDPGPLAAGGLGEHLQHQGRRLVLRPVRPEDAALHREFLAQITQLDLYRRYFTFVREFPAETTAHFTQIDSGREMTFVAVTADDYRPREILAVAHACVEPTHPLAEFAVLVRSDVKGQGLGRLLMLKLIRYCRQRGMRQLRGYVMADNTPMAGLSRALGFRRCRSDGNIEEIALAL